MAELNKHEQLQDTERIISTQEKLPLVLNGKTYKIRQCSQTVETKIHYLLLESYALEKLARGKEQTLKEAKSLQGKLRRIHSKEAAWYLVGNWGLVIPFLHSIRWRLLQLKTSEVVFHIRAVAQGGAQKTFFTLNWESSKAQLKQSMSGLLQGEVLLAKRMESVEAMLKEDFPTNQDSK